jgi:hypothetical protein
MISFFIVYSRVFRDLRVRLIRVLPYWLAIGGIAVSALATLDAMLGVWTALVILILPLAWLLVASVFLALSYWQRNGLHILLDDTRRQFFKDGIVTETWSREVRNAGSEISEKSLDVPMFWDRPFDEPYIVILHTLRKNVVERRSITTKVYEITSEKPEYSEPWMGGRKFYGCTIPVPLGLEPGETMFFKLMYKHRVTLPTDDQIIRARDRMLRLRWEGEANEGLHFDRDNCYVEARTPDPFSRPDPKESGRATRHLAFEEANTRMIVDLPRPKPQYHYRTVFTIL